MTEDFSGKVVMVTGASRGIGREIARQFADRGARVVVHFHKNEEAAQQALEALGGIAHLKIQADLSDAAAVESMTEKVFRQTGKIDALINNAGVYEFHPPSSTSFEDWRRSWEKTLSTNLISHSASYIWANCESPISVH